MIRNSTVPTPENSSVVVGGKPVSTGTRNVAPNMATTCWAPMPMVRGQLSRSSGATTAASDGTGFQVRGITGWTTHHVRLTRQPWDDLVAEALHEADRIGVARHRPDVDEIEAQVGTLVDLSQVVIDVVERIGEQTRGQSDVGEVTADRIAVSAQHVELVGHLVQRRGAVPDVRVLCDQPQRLLLAVATDEDRRAPDRLWLTDGLGQLVVLALVRPVVATPHLLADLQCLLEHLEAVLERRVRHAEREV